MMNILCKCGCGNILTNKGSYIRGHNGIRGYTYEEKYGKEKIKCDIIRIDELEYFKNINQKKISEFNKEKGDLNV